MIENRKRDLESAGEISISYYLFSSPALLQGQRGGGWQPRGTEVTNLSLTLVAESNKGIVNLSRDTP